MTSAPDGPGAASDAAIPIALFGASGRMGHAVVSALVRDPAFRLVGACAGRESRALGLDAGVLAQAGELGVPVVADPREALRGARVAIDFSLPAATPAYATACREAGCALVSGVTGLDRAALDALQSASTAVPVLHEANLSIGVTILERLAALAAGSLDEAFEIEIVETHHHAKRDAPSGTALRLGEVMAAARGLPHSCLRACEDRSGPRDPREIGIAAVRAGDIAGEHTLLFAGPGERIELTHRAGTRAAFASGALRAARWLAGVGTPGRYRMRDVLGL
jgi:4-hydroxy-tetrahydrodipicolinate reductase